MDQQIIDNKLIAEFDKLEQVDYGDNTIIYRREGNLGYKPENLKYNTDWNWLMPVVKKISDTHFHSKKIDPMLDYGRHLFLIHNTLCELDIKKTCAEVVKWITWYNKKRK